MYVYGSRFHSHLSPPFHQCNFFLLFVCFLCPFVSMAFSLLFFFVISLSFVCMCECVVCYVVICYRNLMSCFVMLLLLVLVVSTCVSICLLLYSGGGVKCSVLSIDRIVMCGWLMATRGRLHVERTDPIKYKQQSSHKQSHAPPAQLLPVSYYPNGLMHASSDTVECTGKLRTNRQRHRGRMVMAQRNGSGAKQVIVTVFANGSVAHV